MNKIQITEFIKSMRKKIYLKYRKVVLEIKARINRKQKTIDCYTIEEIKKRKKLILFAIEKLSTREINNFIFLDENTAIWLCPNRCCSLLSDGHDERIYIKALKNIFKILETHQRPYNIEISIKNRELWKQSQILEQIHNINLTILSDCQGYSKEEYLEEEEILDNLVKPVKEAKLSPYETYLAVYNKVKQYKAYKENPDFSADSRYLKYLIHNEYIVCVGFATLLENLLHKVGIPSISIGVDVDTSYDEGFSMEPLPTELHGHQRNIVKIDDDKYNIHGIFIADVTWDNCMDQDLYNNSAITFDRKKEAYRLEAITVEDLLLDFHNFDEFVKKINFFLQRIIKTMSKETYSDKVVHSYKMVYRKIMEILIELDYPKYEYFFKKYDGLLYEKIYEEKATLEEIEEIMSKFLTEYALYIIPLTNKKISDDILFQAASYVKQNIDAYSKEQMKEWNRATRKINEQRGALRFPYKYNPNDYRINYLKRKDKRKVKIKSRYL